MLVEHDFTKLSRTQVVSGCSRFVRTKVQNRARSVAYTLRYDVHARVRYTGTQDNPLCLRVPGMSLSRLVVQDMLKPGLSLVTIPSLTSP